jgi:hypothetical protein
MSQLHTVAVFELGTRLRVLVDGLECTASDAPAVALQTVLDLARLPATRVGLRLIRTDDVTDAAGVLTNPSLPHP